MNLYILRDQQTINTSFFFADNRLSLKESHIFADNCLYLMRRIGLKLRAHSGEAIYKLVGADAPTKK
jgi:hypothetical protein